MLNGWISQGLYAAECVDTSKKCICPIENKNLGPSFLEAIWNILNGVMTGSLPVKIFEK